jgi:hypothetical protein
MSLRSKLGKAAVIGGRDYVEKFATSDTFAAIFHLGLDTAGRKEALEMVVRIAAKAQRGPVSVKSPSRDERVKVRWTDELVARLKAAAPQTKDDFELALRLGYPPYGLLRGSQTGDPRSPPRSGSPAAPLQVAA